jgi:hypothetical protein
VREHIDDDDDDDDDVGTIVNIEVKSKLSERNVRA